MNKSIQSMWALSVAGILLAAQPVSAAPSTVQVSLRSGRGVGLAGEEVAVPLLLNSTPNRGVSVLVGELLFDSTKLTFVKMVAGGAASIDGNEILFPAPLEDGSVPGMKVLPFIILDAALESPAIFGLSNGEQAVVTFRIKAGVAAGPIPLTLTNVVLTDSSSIDAPLEIINFTVTPGEVVVNSPPPPPVVFGDANGDGRFSSQDINETIDWWLERKPMPGGSHFTAADVNGSGGVNVTDINFMIDRWLERIDRFPVET